MVDSALGRQSVREFLKRPLLAELVTLNRSGSPQLTYMWYELDGEEILMSTTTDRVKAKNIARDPRVAASIVDPGDPWRWVIVNGKVELSKEGAFALIDRLGARYLDPSRAEQLGKQWHKEPRIVLRITPEKVRVMGL